MTSLVMPAQRGFERAWRRPVIGQVEVSDVILATVASAAVIALVIGLLPSPGRHGGAAAALVALLMTAPLLGRHRAPVLVCLALGAGAVINVLTIGSMVRCGPALPVLLIAAFTLGYLRDLRLVAVGVVALMVSAVTQSLRDPDLDPGILVVLLPAIVGFGFAGKLLAARRRTADELRGRNRELQEQREATARMAIDADRARISADLDVTLRRQIDEIAGAAAATDATQQAEADAALAHIETTGRDALSHMRAVVGALRPANRAPSPVLSQLDALLERATSSDARLTIVGAPFQLPPGVELTGYRIVEHLLVALEDSPRARIDVTVTFSTHAVDIDVRGPASRLAARTAAVAAARERAALHGGRLDERAVAGRYQITARLPLVSAGA